jgi:hypothetical protein
MKPLARWLLVPVAGILAWYAALFGTLALDGVLRRLLYPCPPDLVVSGLCGADWYRASVDAATCFGAGLAAFLIVTGCVAMAPACKRIVALVTFLLGTGVALYGGFSSQAYAPMVTAILVGAVTTLMVGRKSAPARLA